MISNLTVGTPLLGSHSHWYRLAPTGPASRPLRSASQTLDERPLFGFGQLRTMCPCWSRRKSLLRRGYSLVFTRYSLAARPSLLQSCGAWGYQRGSSPTISQPTTMTPTCNWTFSWKRTGTWTPNSLRIRCGEFDLQGPWLISNWSAWPIYHQTESVWCFFLFYFKDYSIPWAQMSDCQRLFLADEWEMLLSSSLGF